MPCIVYLQEKQDHATIQIKKYDITQKYKTKKCEIKKCENLLHVLPF